MGKIKAQENRNYLAKKIIIQVCHCKTVSTDNVLAATLKLNAGTSSVRIVKLSVLQ